MNLAQLIANEAKTYSGNLIPYFKIVMDHAKNLGHPYHNFRHMFHVTFLFHEACELHVMLQIFGVEIGPRDIRKGLIASIFHDFDHSGGIIGRDHEEIKRAIAALRTHILEEDRPDLEDIEYLIQATEFPHHLLPPTPKPELSVLADIIRDADLSQGLDSAWMQQVIFGLSKEVHLTPLEMLRVQEVFLEGCRFRSPWGKQVLAPKRDARIIEVRQLLSFLNEG